MAQPNERTSQLKELDDEQLVQQYKHGEMAAFETLIERYRLELFHFLARFTGDRIAAEDIFQEAFLQVHLSAETFDQERRFKPWLFTIAANKARDHMRKQSRRPTVPLSAPVGGSSDDDSQSFIDLMKDPILLPHEQLAERETAEKVQQILSGLPDHLREILLLAYFQKLAYNEIAQALQIPLGTVKSRLHTAVASFAKNWKKENPIPPLT